ncbi:Antitoxin component YwqK of the YwqJK toxin-antitoxin module [Variovorax sp. OK605]|uniref:toxin-antitoxin system YwqK family antitoxin n=1 Tax=Variovorax sp. OK605 TaxID=1855317 RepID=UPI0008EE5768|nr:Antitoxin component YwqK of the YwqJK toxin-antitoxin module [Variovorax sp. OK605]
MIPRRAAPCRPAAPTGKPGRWLRLGLAALVPLFGAAAAHAQQDCDLNGRSVNPSNGASTDGKTGLMRCKDRASGELQREEQLQNGVYMGLVRIYEKGKLAKEHSVNAKGNIQGRAREFSPAGRVLREATYDDGQERGLVRSFYPDGKLRRVVFYPDTGNGSERASAEFTERGQLSALRCADAPTLSPAVDDAKLCGFAGTGASQVELFDAQGNLRSRLAYVSGKRTRSQSFYDNGKTAVLDETVGNQRTEQNYSSEGVKRRETAYLLVERANVRVREQAFSEKGTLVRDQRWNSAGEPIVDDSYYLNGQPSSKSAYGNSGDMRTVEITEFYDSGERAAQGRYQVVGRSRQIPVGTHQRFSEKGKLLAESTFDAKGRITRERVWDENGELQRDDEVFEDGSRKAFAQ